MGRHCRVPPPGGCPALETPQGEGFPLENRSRQDSNLSPKTKPPLCPRASRTLRTRPNASPGEMPLCPEKVGCRAERAVPDIPSRGRAAARGASLASPPCPGSPHTLATRARARAAGPRGPALGPRSPLAADRPDRSGIRHSGVEQRAEKRRGKRKGGGRRPPRSRGHPKGESRKKDRETRRGWGGRPNAARRASSGRLSQIASPRRR